MSESTEETHFKPGLMRAPEHEIVLRSLEETIRRWPSALCVEVGTRRAGTSGLIADRIEKTIESMNLPPQSVPPKFVGVDNDKEALQWWKERFDPKYWNPHHCVIDFLFGQSQKIGKESSEPIHWLLIDGCHCLTCVQGDMEAWLPRVIEGGSVLFHDSSRKLMLSKHYTEHGRTRRIGVRVAMKNSKFLSKNFELVQDLDIGGRDKEGNKNVGIAWFRRRKDANS